MPARENSAHQSLPLARTYELPSVRPEQGERGRVQNLDRPGPGPTLRRDPIRVRHSGLPICLVVTTELKGVLPPELGSNLEVSLPEVQAVTESGLREHDSAEPDAVWILGCPATDLESVATMRSRFPRAFVLVTSRDLSAARAVELEQAGADRALTWAGTIAGVRRELAGAFV